MSEEKRTLLVEITKELKQLDETSLKLLKMGAELLRARETVDLAAAQSDG